MKSLGNHILAELYRCDSSIIDDLEKVQAIMLHAAKISNATILAPLFHKFSPNGISGLILIAESHFTIHTWPERRFAAVDIFSCRQIDISAAIDYITAACKAEDRSIVEIPRGVISRLDGITGDNTLPEENHAYGNSEARSTGR